jgi:hypothetical protein
MSKRWEKGKIGNNKDLSTYLGVSFLLKMSPFKEI